jgi:hypothetical protein
MSTTQAVIPTTTMVAEEDKKCMSHDEKMKYALGLLLLFLIICLIIYVICYYKPSASITSTTSPFELGQTPSIPAPAPAPVYKEF